MLVRTQVESNLSIEKGISVGTEGLEGEALLGKNFKQRIKSSVETTVLNSMGSILMSLGQQMISTKGSSLSFEERINKFSQSIEREIAVRTATIEKKAQELCADIVKVDTLEEELKSTVEPLLNMNVFTVTQ